MRPSRYTGYYRIPSRPPLPIPVAERLGALANLATYALNRLHTSAVQLAQESPWRVDTAHALRLAAHQGQQVADSIDELGRELVFRQLDKEQAAQAQRLRQQRAALLKAAREALETLG